MRRAILSLVVVYAVIALAGGLVILFKPDSPDAKIRHDHVHGGTAQQWYNETQDWEHLTHKEHHIADRYRKLNNKLLKLCPQ